MPLKKLKSLPPPKLQINDVKRNPERELDIYLPRPSLEHHTASPQMKGRLWWEERVRGRHRITSNDSAVVPRSPRKGLYPSKNRLTNIKISTKSPLQLLTTSYYSDQLLRPPNNLPSELCLYTKIIIQSSAENCPFPFCSFDLIVY